MKTSDVIPVFFEEVTETVAGHITASNLRIATRQEIAHAQKLHEEGKCPHNIVTDESGWLYDFRTCVTCGKGLGAI